MIDRRTAIKWVMVAGAASQLPDFTFAATEPQASATGYGKDPDLLKRYAAGDLWPLTLRDAQLRTVTVLCDLIIPADDRSPAASAVAVPKFIDEWISAPYPSCARDREIIVAGLGWLNEEAQRRYTKDFAALSEEQLHGICDDICDLPKAAPKFAQAAAFFDRFRALTAAGFYTTPVGRKDLQYVGNEPLPAFEGPPPEVLKKVGLA